MRETQAARFYEVPISYHGRTYEEGKKIGWKDGVKALGVIFRFWLIDDLYTEPYGRAFLNNLTGTPQYLNWLARVLRLQPQATPCWNSGSGIGNVAGHLMGRRLHYVSRRKRSLVVSTRSAIDSRAHPKRRGSSVDPERLS